MWLFDSTYIWFFAVIIGIVVAIQLPLMWQANWFPCLLWCCRKNEADKDHESDPDNLVDDDEAFAKQMNLHTDINGNDDKYHRMSTFDR